MFQESNTFTQPFCDPRHELHTRIIQHATECFQKHGQLMTHRIECSFRDGTLILTGRVPRYYVKQLAQTVIRHIEGVQQIVNDLEVTPRR